MLKNTFLAAVTLICLMLAPVVHAATSTYGWEDGVGTILGSYNDIDAFNVGSPDPVHSGSRSLKLVDKASSGTPQAYVAWITGLEDGDTVEAGFWRYDITSGSAPSCCAYGSLVPVSSVLWVSGGMSGTVKPVKTRQRKAKQGRQCAPALQNMSISH